MTNSDSGDDFITKEPLWGNKTLKYRLTDNDYRSLWMAASPRQIREEFGDKSHSVRTIYRIYKKYGISGINDHKQQIRLEISKGSGATLDEGYINHKLKERFKEKRETAFAAMWAKIDEFEARF